MCAKEFGEGLGQSEWEMWKQRYGALQTMLTTLKERRVLGDEGEGVPRRATFSILLSKLQAFADEQFNFLYDGLRPDGNQGYRLEPSLRYSADFVLGGTLDQVSFDLNVLQEAWYQRVLAKDDPAIRRTLEIADQLAHFALLPAVWHGLLPYKEEEITVLTYFQKSPRIRVIPYACVALVGIPYTTLATYEAGGESAVGNARDFLAIPHEIGHYVYQHGLAVNRRLQFELYDVLQGKPDWLLTWAEEIFADVYGCFIAGPVIARDFQDLMRDNDVEAFLEDDGEHPTPALRPLVYCDALRILAERVGDEDERARLEAFAAEAEKQWDDVRRHRGEEHIAQRRKIIKEAVEITFGELIKSETVSVRRLWSVLDREAAPPTQYEDLYERFYEGLVAEDGLFQRLERQAPGAAEEDGDLAKPEPVEPRRPPDLEEAWETPEHRIPTLRSLRRIRNGRPEALPVGETQEEEVVEGEKTAVGGALTGDYEVVPAEVWTLVASMHGWATNGPEDDPDPKIK